MPHPKKPTPPAPSSAPKRDQPSPTSAEAARKRMDTLFKRLRADPNCEVVEGGPSFVIGGQPPRPPKPKKR